MSAWEHILTYICWNYSGCITHFSYCNNLGIRPICVRNEFESGNNRNFVLWNTAMLWTLTFKPTLKTADKQLYLIGNDDLFLFFVWYPQQTLLKTYKSNFLAQESNSLFFCTFQFHLLSLIKKRSYCLLNGLRINESMRIIPMYGCSTFFIINYLNIDPYVSLILWSMYPPLELWLCH